jgi:uncharacterized protein (UPF0333 family)
LALEKDLLSYFKLLEGAPPHSLFYAQTLFQRYMVEKSMKSSGQVSAPFEVLIAVILMSFVLFAGYNAMQQLEKQTCANTINSQLEKMAQNLQNVATGKGSAQFNFSFEKCSAKINDCKNFGALAAETDIECIQLIDSTDPNICSSHCPSARSICSLLVYKSARSSTTIKCVDISPSTVFPSQGSSQCIDLSDDGFVLKDFTS